jgi:hypothetical protein
MSGWCIATSVIYNSSGFSFGNPSGGTPSSGHWVISPQPIAVDATDFLAFQAQGADGTATGAVGSASYDCFPNGSTTPAGSLTFNFSDPYDGSNSCSASSTVAGLVAKPSYNTSGRTLNINWTISYSPPSGS